jgi:tetratricopeptide (TPR) repeat protein
MGEPSAESMTLANLRKIRGWGQKKLAAEAGLELDTISVYERRRCSREQLQRFGGLMGFSVQYVQRSLALVQEGREHLARPGTASREEAASREIDAVAAEEGRRVQEFLRSSLRRLDRAAHALLERRAAPRRLPEALDLLDRAFKLARTDRALGRILLLRAKTLEEMDDYVSAIRALQQATPYIERSGNLHLLLNLRFNLLENEVQEGRSVDVPRRLAQVRDLAIDLRNDLDLIRLRWLEGRLAANSGQRAEAERAFRSVQDEFGARQMYYDMALVLLESAVLLLEEGRTAEVRELATCMEVIFCAEGVHREAIAALCLFQRAALQERATVELARRVLAFFRRSRNNPELRFEGAPSPERQKERGKE